MKELFEEDRRKIVRRINKLIIYATEHEIALASINCTIPRLISSVSLMHGLLDIETLLHNLGTSYLSPPSPMQWFPCFTSRKKHVV